MVDFPLMDDRLGWKKVEKCVAEELDLVLNGLTGKKGDNFGVVVDGDSNLKERMLNRALLPNGPKSFALKDDLGLGSSSSSLEGSAKRKWKRLARAGISGNSFASVQVCRKRSFEMEDGYESGVAENLPL